jgi:hypothetical protein
MCRHDISFPSGKITTAGSARLAEPVPASSKIGFGRPIMRVAFEARMG